MEQLEMAQTRKEFTAALEEAIVGVACAGVSLRVTNTQGDLGRLLPRLQKQLEKVNKAAAAALDLRLGGMLLDEKVQVECEDAAVAEQAELLIGVLPKLPGQILEFKRVLALSPLECFYRLCSTRLPPDASHVADEGEDGIDATAAATSPPM